MRRLIVSMLFSIASVQAATYEVDKNNGSCNDTTCAPCCTIQGGLNKVAAAGDIVDVRTGTYQECAATSWSSSLEGTSANPIIIRGHSGETVTIDGNGTCASPGLGCISTDSSVITAVRASLFIRGTHTADNRINYIKIENFTVKPPDSVVCDDSGAMCGGVMICGLDNSEISNVRTTSQSCLNISDSDGSAASSNADAIVSIIGSHNILIRDTDFGNAGTRCADPADNDESWQAFYYRGAQNLTIAGAKIRDMGSAFCGSVGSNNISEFFNDIANTEGLCDGHNTVQLYNGDFFRLQWNRYSHQHNFTTPRGDCSSGCGSDCSSSNNNCARLVIAQNTIARTGGGTVSDEGVLWSNDATRPGRQIIANNLWTGFDKPLLYCSGSEAEICNDAAPFTCTAYIASNGYWSNTTNALTNSSALCPSIAETGRVNMVTTSPLDGNSCPASGSNGDPIKNVGTLNYSVPVASSSSLTDLGACDADTGGGCWTGSSAYPCAFKSLVNVTTTTPIISWSGSGGDVNLTNLDFTTLHTLFGTSIENQVGYRCQVDSSYYFNSEGPSTPIWDSGVVASTTATSCQVAAGNLTTGQSYYVRVRLTSSAWTTGEIWSEPFARFTVGTSPLSDPKNFRGAGVVGGGKR